MAAGIPLADLEDLKKGKNHLFGIGINTYQHFNPLPNARKDVEDVAMLLSENYYFEPANVRLLCDAEATKENITEELYELRNKIQADDRLIIYYSGHGFKEGNSGFWIPVDAKRDRKATYINNVEVRDIIHSIAVRHILLISDSCFSASLLVRDAAREVGGAFTDWIRKPSRYVFISGGGVVSDGKEGENSPFAASFMKNLRQNRDEAIEISTLAAEVAKEIRWNYPQLAELSPLYQAGHEGGQFVFLKKQTERDDWENALKQNWEGGYRAYLDKYPNGQFEKDAYQKLFEIADEKEWRKAASLDAMYAYLQYLKKYPAGGHAADARAKLDWIEKEEEKERKAFALQKERERLAQMETDRKERERLALLEAEKKERERLALLETEKKERERLARLEVEKKERERLALTEEQKREQARIAQLEAAKKETELLAFVEAQQKERERLAQVELYEQKMKQLAQIEADKKERERVERIEAQKREQAAQMEALKKEQERQRQIEADNQDRQRLADTANQSQPATTPVAPSFFQKYQTLLIGGGIAVLALFFWFSPGFTGITTGPANSPSTGSPATGKVQAAPYEAPPVIKPAADGNNQIGETKNSAQETKKLDLQKQKDLDIAKKYLTSAAAYLIEKRYIDAKEALANAANIGILTTAAQDAISNATFHIDGKEYPAAIKAIQTALKTVQ